MFADTEFKLNSQFRGFQNTPISFAYESYTFLNEQSTPERFLGTSDVESIALDNFTSPSLAPFDYTSTPAPMISSRDRLPEQINAPGKGPSTPKMANSWRRAALASAHDGQVHPGAGPVTPLRNLSTPSLSTPTWSSASSSVEDALTPWDYENELPTPNILQDSVYALNVDTFNSEAVQSWYSWDPPSPSCLTVKSRKLGDNRKRAAKTSQSQISPMKISSEAGYDKVTLDLVPKPMFSCRYLGCHKVFRRREHLKRHKQTYVDGQP